MSAPNWRATEAGIISEPSKLPGSHVYYWRAEDIRRVLAGLEQQVA